MYVELQVDNKRANIKRLVIRSQAVIGRQNHCDIRVVSTEISREHCRISIKSSAALLVDLGSTNGTFLNKKRIEPHKEITLKNEDLIHVGPAAFTVHLIESPGELEATLPADETIASHQSATPQAIAGAGLAAQLPGNVSPQEEIVPDVTPDDDWMDSESNELLISTDESAELLIDEESENVEEEQNSDDSYLAGVASDIETPTQDEDDPFGDFLKDL